LEKSFTLEILHIFLKNKMDWHTLKICTFLFPLKEKEDMFQNVLSQMAEQFSR